MTTWPRASSKGYKVKEKNSSQAAIIQILTDFYAFAELSISNGTLKTNAPDHSLQSLAGFNYCADMKVGQGL